MEEKPVIILGGGLWGSLLAYRLHMIHPSISFKIYEEDSSLGGQYSHIFQDNTVDKEAFKWLRPFIERSWDRHQIRFHSYNRWLDGRSHMISPQLLNQIVTRALPQETLRLCNKLPMELALKESSFVIDTRNICYLKNAAFQKHVCMTFQLESHHGIEFPVMDGSVEQKEKFRYVQYFPISDDVLLVKDVRFSGNRVLDLASISADILKLMSEREWKIKSLLRQEDRVMALPLSNPIVRQEGRVINLAGLFHDTSGSQIQLATMLIDKMIATSFRFGELSEVVKSFRKNMEPDRKFLRYINQMILQQKSKRRSVFENLFQLPVSVLNRFHSGKLSLLDRSRIVLNGMTLPNLVLKTRTKL